jgi:uncharacterized membrane protein YccF (DUF307 family)
VENTAPDLVGPARATWTWVIQRLAFFPMPHEMIHHELQSPSEQVQQRLGTIRAVKDVSFFDAQHWQLAPHLVNLVTGAGELFLSLK